MAPQCELIGVIYLFVVLHLLFLLVLLEQHLVALSLLIAFFVKLPIPPLKPQTRPQLNPSTNSDLTSHLIVGSHKECARELKVSTPAIIARCSGVPREDCPRLSPPNSPAQEAEAETVEVVVAEVERLNIGGCTEDGGGAADASVDSDTSAREKQDEVVPASNGFAKQCPYSTYSSVLHGGWVWATAVLSLFSVCSSVVLWLFVSRCSSQDADGTSCSAPSWACRKVPQTLLHLFTGIRVEQGGVRISDFFFTVVGLSVVGSFSVAQALCAALLRCRRFRCAHASCRTSSVVAKIDTLLVKGFTFVPLSPLWICTAGIGQGTLFGCVYIVLATLLLLNYPRCVLFWRRQCWLLYVVFLLLLWTVQACFRLPWIRESLGTNVADVPPGSVRARHNGSLFVMWRLLVPETQTASSAWPWQLSVEAIGVWWAGVEYLCFHTVTYASIMAASRTARVWQAAQCYRISFRRALAAKEEKQQAHALEQERAAYRKVEQLRLERENVAASTHNKRRTRRDVYANKALLNERCIHSRPHAPFGNCASQRCLMEDGSETRSSAQAIPGSPASLSAVFVRSLGDWNSICASVINSSRSSWYESEDQHTLHAPLMPHAATSEQQERQCRSTSQHLTNKSKCRTRSNNSSDEGNSFETTCPSPTAATAKLGDDDIVSRNVHVSNGSSNAESRPPNGSQQWASGPTRSPTRPVNDENHDKDENENTNRFLDLLNTTPFASSSLPSSKRKPLPASAASSLGPDDIPVISDCFSPRAPHGGGAHHSTCKAACGFSSFNGTTSTRMIVGGTSPVGRDAGWSTSYPSSPSAICAAELPTTKTADKDAVNSHSAESGRSGVIYENHPPRRSTSTHRIYDALNSLQKKAKVYLTAHTLTFVDENKHMNAGVTTENTEEHERSGSADFECNPNAAPSETHESSFKLLFVDYVLQHWFFFCALLSLVHFTVSSTAVNLAPSLATLVYALLQRPWPPRWFVRVEALYVAGSLFAKCLLRALFGSGFIPSISITTARCLNTLFFPCRLCNSSSATSSTSATTASVATWESWLDIMMSVVVLYVIMVQWALVYADQSVLGCGGDGPEAHAEDSVFPDTLPTRSSSLVQVNNERKLHTTQYVSCLSRWNRHRCGAGADYYSIQLFFDLLSLVFFCWAYYVIAPGDMTPSLDNVFYAVQHNRLPGVFVATALVLVVVLFAERITYVLHAFMAKYALHLLLAVTYHALYLVWHTVNSSNNNRNNSSTVVLLMVAKLASLWCGALQLRHGYPLHRTHDPFTVKTDVLHWFGHMVFRAVPFLLELRVLLDWSFSATTLKVQHWMLLEDIHHNVYRRFVDMHDLHWTSRHQGRRFPYYVRVYQGMLSFAAILLALFFPLFWYSTFGPQVRKSKVTAWTSEVAFRGFSALPLFTVDGALSSTTFRTAATTSIGDVTPNPTDLLRFASASDTWQLVQPPQCSSQMWSYTPAALAQLLEELRTEDSQQRQRGRAELVVRNRVTRSRAVEASYVTCGFEESYTLSTATAAALVRVLETWQAADVNGTSAEFLLRPVTVALPSFYTPYVVNTGSAVATMTSAAIAKVDCTLTLHRVGQYRGFMCLICIPLSTTTEANESSADAALKLNTASQLPSTSFVSPAAISPTNEHAAPQEHTLVYIVASSDVTTVQSSLSLIPNVGIIALYTSFILAISTYFRNFFAGDAHRVVLLQLPNPEPVAELLRYIYLVRSFASNGQVGDLWLEQLLFLELLDLLRSPERLMKLGGRRVDDYVKGEYREDLYASTKRPFGLQR